MAITGWRHYADPGVAPLCRSWNGSIWAIINMVLVPSEKAALACAIGEAHRRYTRSINFRKDWRGYL